MSKKQKMTLIFVSVAVLAAILYYSLAKKTVEDGEIVPPPPGKTSSLPPQKLARAREVFQGKRAPIPTREDASVSPECRKMWGALREVDVIAAFSDPRGVTSLPEKNPDCLTVPAEMADTHDHYANLCGALRTMDPKTTPRDVWDRTRQGCYAVTTVYRAQITEWATKDVPLDQISDPRILADKAIARFVTSPSLSADAADRLLEVEPELSPAARLSAIGRFLQARQEKDTPGVDRTWDRAEAAMDRAKRQAPEAGLEVAELEVWAEASRRGDPAAIRRRAEEMITAYPKSGMGHFFASYAEYKAGNREKMKDAMRQAAAVDPSPRYREALERIEATPEGKDPGIFNSQISFPLDQLLPAS